MKNIIVDVYPDNEAKFNLPYQYIAPFPVEVTDHLYWSEATLGNIHILLLIYYFIDS